MFFLCAKQHHSTCIIKIQRLKGGTFDDHIYLNQWFENFNHIERDVDKMYAVTCSEKLSTHIVLYMYKIMVGAQWLSGRVLD